MCFSRTHQPHAYPREYRYFFNLQNRSSCMAGYKACTVVAADSNPDSDFFDSVRPGFGSALSERVPGSKTNNNLRSPGEKAGTLSNFGANTLLAGLAGPGMFLLLPFCCRWSHFCVCNVAEITHCRTRNRHRRCSSFSSHNRCAFGCPWRRSWH